MTPPAEPRKTPIDTRALLPEIDLDRATELALRTDYALDACETEHVPINTGDAGAFFLEGYMYARTQIRLCLARADRPMTSRELPPPNASGHRQVPAKGDHE